jgi:hypothetical protein
MNASKTKSERALIHMVATLVVVLGALAGIALWNSELFVKIYLVDRKTVILNGFILLIFFSGLVYLIRAFVHLKFEERQVLDFIRTKETDQFSAENFAADALITQRYETVKDLYDRRVPIHHGAIASITAASESLYGAYPKFVNNVLILTGVFGTIVSLIFALVGAGTVLETSIPGEGMGVMLLGMNTALTTTATAIVCFFLFTYFYQRFTDIQTYVLSKVEEASLIHIVPEFAFDSETVNYKTERLIREVSDVVAELRKGVDFLLQSLADVNRHNEEQLLKTETLIAGQDAQLGKAKEFIDRLEKIEAILIEGFRLNKS